MPAIATIEKLPANGTMDDTALPEEVHLYKDDLDLKYQLSILPDVIQVRNEKFENNLLITKVTNAKTICSILAEVSFGKEMLSEVVCLIKLFSHHLYC